MKTTAFTLAAAALLFVSCASGMRDGNVRSDTSVPHQAAKSSAAQGLAGVWLDPETNDLHTIVADGSGFRVSSVVEQNDSGVEAEKMEMKTSEWENGILSWSYFVPSTGYSVYFKTVSLDGDNLETEWVNRDSAGVTRSGKETLTRFEDMPKDGESGEPAAEGENKEYY